MDEIKKELMKNKLFSGIPQDALDAIAPYIIEREFPKGRIIFFEGDIGKVLYLVKEGVLEIFKKDRNGNIRTIAELKKWDFVGEMAIVDEIPRSAGCRAKEDTKLFLLTKRAFEEIIEKQPSAGCQILLAIIKTISGRLRTTIARL